MSKKLSEIVEQYAKKKLEGDPVATYLRAIGRSSEKQEAEYRLEAWLLIMDAISEDIFKLVGDGSSHYGERLISKRLGIPPYEQVEKADAKETK